MDKFKDFLKGEVRYASVMKQYPSEAEELFQAAQDNALWRYNNYKRLANNNGALMPNNHKNSQNR